MENSRRFSRVIFVSHDFEMEAQGILDGALLTSTPVIEIGDKGAEFWFRHDWDGKNFLDALGRMADDITSDRIKEDTLTQVDVEVKPMKRVITFDGPNGTARETWIEA